MSQFVFHLQQLAIISLQKDVGDGYLIGIVKAVIHKTSDERSLSHCKDKYSAVMLSVGQLCMIFLDNSIVLAVQYGRTRWYSVSK